jgi:two-component sensor histidine kinase
MRTYDYEAQLTSFDNQKKAVQLSRKFYNYLKSKDMLEMYAFNNMATTFELAGQTDSAVYYYNAAIYWAKLHPEVDLSGSYESLSGVYAKLGHYRESAQALDSALKIFTRNTRRVQAEKIEELKALYQTEKKDQAIVSLQEATTLNRRIILQQRWFFAGGLVLVIMVSLYFYNNYRRKLLLEKNEKLTADNKRLRLEQKTLQLQLNPHFIYNSIANLQGLISQGEKDEASTYLFAFSQLMRSVLELNREEFIPLREEIETLESYIRLQQMRFRDVFEYRIETGSLELDDVLIPPMLVQPLVENAIEHGFKGMARQGNLWLRFTQREQHLEVSVSDNGQGLSNTKGPAKKSLSQSITRERLDVLFNREEVQAFLETEQNPEPGIGYRVKMSIPLVHV